MSWNTVRERWHEFRGYIRDRWSELTPNDIAELSGERNQLVTKIQDRYGIARDEAEDEVDAWVDALTERM